MGGLLYAPSRQPLLPDGRPWPIADHDRVKILLAPQRGVFPSMTVFVPADGVGPLLAGSTLSSDLAQPNGYDTVFFRGTPQETYSKGTQTLHAFDSIDEGLKMAASNWFSTIFFNRSFSTATNGEIPSLLRPDVIGVGRPSLHNPFVYHPYESLSNRQKLKDREAIMPKSPKIARL